MIVGLDHVAIAVDDLDAAIRRFVDDLGLELAGTEEVPEQRTATALLPLRGTRIELVAPMDGEGPVARFLERRGGGLHHLCFETDDIEADMARLRERGWRLLSEEPQPGAHGTRVVFVHPASTGGVLVELAEHPKGGR